MFIDKLAWYTYDLSTLILLAVLITACAFDLRRSRIPNWLVLAGITTGVSLHTYFAGLPGFASSLVGMAVGNCILLPFYLVKIHGHRLMGAGDVKLMAAVGAFLGPMNTLLAAGLTLGAGTVAGLAYLFWHGLLARHLQRYWLTLKSLLVTGQWIYQAPDKDDIAMRRFPYSLAIAAGTLLALAHLSYLNFYHLNGLLRGVFL